VSLDDPPPGPLSLGAKLLFVILGGILLLPGLCAAGFMAFFGIAFVQNPRDMISDIGITLQLVVLWAVCFLIAWGGFRLLRRAFR
jgi:hypothetical protein